MLRPVHGSTSLQQGLLPVISVGSSAGVRLLQYLDNWLVFARSLPLLLHHCDHLLQFCRDLGTAINWEKSDLQPSLWSNILAWAWTPLGRGSFLQILACFGFKTWGLGFLPFLLHQRGCGNSCRGHMASLEVWNLLVQPHVRKFRYILGTLHLHTWRLSSNLSTMRDFLGQLQKLQGLCSSGR